MSRTGNRINKTEFLAVLLVLLGIGIAFCIGKEDFFADEMAQYGLANSYYEPFLRTIYDDNLDDRIISGEELLDYIIVDKEHRFSFDSVYYNQTQDVHPPLYYMVTHLICSIFYGRFSKWTGLVPNLIMLVLILLLLYKIGIRLFDSHSIGILMMILYGTSTSAISNYTMIRMYQPLALLTVLLAYEVLLLLQRAAGTDELGVYPAIFLTICAGMLTQYFYLFYAFFVCAGVFFYLLWKKRFRPLAFFSASALGGVAAMVLIYPYILTSLSGQRNLSVDYSLSRCVRDLIQMVLYLGRGMLLCAVVGAVGVVLLITRLIACRRTRMQAVQSQTGDRRSCRIAYTLQFWILETPAILAFLVIAIIGPQERYVFHLIPFVVLMVGFIWKQVTAKSVRAENFICHGLVKTVYITAAVFVAWFIYKPSFWYHGTADSHRVAEQYSTSPCVYMNGDNEEVGIVGNLIQLSNFDDICLQLSPWSDTITEYIENHADNDTIVVYIAELAYAADDLDEIDILTRNLTSTYSVELVRFGDFTRMYLLKKVD
jgi:hypothetical protein